MGKLQLRYRNNGFEYFPQLKYIPGPDQADKPEGEWKDFVWGKQIDKSGYLDIMAMHIANMHGRGSSYYTSRKEKEGPRIYFKTKPQVCAWLAGVQAFYAENSITNFVLDFEEVEG